MIPVQIAMLLHAAWSSTWVSSSFCLSQFPLYLGSYEDGSFSNALNRQRCVHIRKCWIKSYFKSIRVSCALTRGHCTTCSSVINNLLTCLAALCSVACFTTLPGVLECWFPWQPDIAFLFFITITVLLLPCSNVLSSLFCLGVCAGVCEPQICLSKLYY